MYASQINYNLTVFFCTHAKVLIFKNLSFLFWYSLYKEEKIDGTNSGVKWSCPNIHDLVTILEKLKIELILDNVFDKRLSKLEDLSVAQLKEECQSNNLEKRGTKVENVI